MSAVFLKIIILFMIIGAVAGAYDAGKKWKNDPLFAILGTSLGMMIGGAFPLICHTIYDILVWML